VAIATSMNTNGVLSIFGVLTGLDTSAGDVTLTNLQFKDNGIFVGATGHAANSVIVPKMNGKVFVVIAPAAANILFETPGGTAVTVAAGKTAILAVYGDEVVRLTADA
jgi:hypothetical protein